MNEETHIFPSRALNEPPEYFGLDVWDICAIGYVFILSHAVLGLLHLELVSFGVALFFAYALSIIRLNKRRRIIRDWIAFKLGITKVLYDPAP